MFQAVTVSIILQRVISETNPVWCSLLLRALLVTVAAQAAAAVRLTSYCVHNNNFVVIPPAYLSRHRQSVRALGIP